MESVESIEQKKVQIHKAYIVSCVNSRVEDLARAASVLKGKKVADGVELYVAAASSEGKQRNSIYYLEVTLKSRHFSPNSSRRKCHQG